MSRQPETVLIGRIVDAIRAAYPDAWVFKVHGSPYQMAGVPDLLVCVSGHLIALEVKCQRPGESEEHARGRVTLVQQGQINALDRAGATALCVLSPEEALRAIEENL